jgi:hypothetical protein
MVKGTKGWVTKKKGGGARGLARLSRLADRSRTAWRSAIQSIRQAPTGFSRYDRNGAAHFRARHWFALLDAKPYGKALYRDEVLQGQLLIFRLQRQGPSRAEGARH